MALWNHNLPSGRLKNQLWWSRCSDISRGPQAMRLHFLYPSNQKNRLGQSCLSDALSRRKALGTIICLQDVLRKDTWSRWSDISRCRIAMRNNFVHPGHRKKQLGPSRLSHVLSRRMGLRTHNLLSGRLKIILEKSMKRLKVSNGHAFPESWGSKKWTRSMLIKWCFN
jgi:hypothetical protein